MRALSFLAVYFSPFKFITPTFYIGEIALGTPYFFPRVWVKMSSKEIKERAEEDTNKFFERTRDKDIKVTREQYYKATIDRLKRSKTSAPKAIGFDFVGLGWKTKWDEYRFEWNPIWSFVFFKWQIALTFAPEHADHYWEAWLYYSRDTDKTKSKKERIQQCMEEFPLFYSVHSNGTSKAVDYYQLIIKPEYL